MEQISINCGDCMALCQPGVENTISVAMSEGNKHGVPSTVSVRIVAAYLNATAPVSQPAAWIIERPGRLPTMIHYAGCAEKAQAMGYVVTPYYSKLP